MFWKRLGQDWCKTFKKGEVYGRIVEVRPYCNQALKGRK